MTREEFARENMALRHAIQTGAAYLVEFTPEVDQYKHLRTPIDAQQAELAALLTLLVDKGMFTWEEYYDASIKALKEEVGRYEAELTRILVARGGTPETKITLG